MEEQIVSFEVAKLAKEKRFNWKVTSFYYPEDRVGLVKECKYTNYNADIEVVEMISAPTQSLLQKWLREVHNIHINITHLTFNQLYRVNNITSGWDESNSGILKTHGFNKFETYEEALEEGLKQTLLNI